jgi:hypothetical protein
MFRTNQNKRVNATANGGINRELDVDDQIIKTYADLRVKSVVEKYCTNSRYILEQEGISVADLQPSKIKSSAMYKQMCNP